MWRHLWPPDIINTLISDRDPEGNLEKSNLELSVLVLHRATLLGTYPEATVAAPQSGSDNTPTVSWSTREASTINPVVGDLLHIRALHSCQFFSNLRSSTTQAWKIAWRMTHLAYFIYLKHHFFSTCLSPTCSRTCNSKSAPCRRNCFHV